MRIVNFPFYIFFYSSFPLSRLLVRAIQKFLTVKWTEQIFALVAKCEKFGVI